MPFVSYNIKFHEKRKIAINIAILFLFVLLVIMIVPFIEQGNNKLTFSYCRINSPKITKPIKIVLLSDLHNKQFGKNNNELYKAVIGQKPDLIAFTGDLEDRRQPYNKYSVSFLARLSENVPVLYVFGNQEMSVDYKPKIAEDLKNGGVTVLDGRITEIKVKNQSLAVLGLNDYLKNKNNRQPLYNSKKLLEKFQKTDNFKLLLTHYPQYFHHYFKDYQYSDYNIDLVLAGHAHGGLIRFPFLKGAAAPGQGLFPRYTSGLYQQDGVKMIVSRGLGNSGIFFRINNPPDIVVINILPE